jgi:hypothetical protein
MDLLRSHYRESKLTIRATFQTGMIHPQNKPPIWRGLFCAKAAVIWLLPEVPIVPLSPIPNRYPARIRFTIA